MPENQLPLTFRPLAARIVSISLAILVFALMAWLSVLSVAESWWNVVGFASFALIINWFLYRQAAVKLVCTESGLQVRNLWQTTELSWAQVLHVMWGPDIPWVRLDCSDGTVIPVMAIQNADGNRAQVAATTLIDLVAVLPKTSGTPPEV